MLQHCYVCASHREHWCLPLSVLLVGCRSGQMSSNVAAFEPSVWRWTTLTLTRSRSRSRYSASWQRAVRASFLLTAVTSGRRCPTTVYPATSTKTPSSPSLVSATARTSSSTRRPRGSTTGSRNSEERSSQAWVLGMRRTRNTMRASGMNGFRSSGMSLELRHHRWNFSSRPTL